MFFDSIEQIPAIATSVGFSIFVVDPNITLALKDALYLAPDEKNKISVDAVREFTNLASTKQTKDKYFIVREPEQMSSEAANAFLKSLEEPKDNYHFVFLTKNASSLLPTIRSRGQIFTLKTDYDFSAPIDAPEDVKNLAKRLISARERDLPDIAKEVSAKKDRNFALNIVSVAIEMSYKTFFLTDNPKFLRKIPNFLHLYENILANGHIKLHFVADML